MSEPCSNPLRSLPNASLISRLLEIGQTITNLQAEAKTTREEVRWRATGLRGGVIDKVPVQFLVEHYLVTVTWQREAKDTTVEIKELPQLSTRPLDPVQDDHADLDSR